MNRRQLIGMVTIALAAGVLGYVAHAARAGGVPTPNTMAYTGVLTNAAGTPAPGQGVQLSIWNAVSGGTAVCGPYAAVTTAGDGSFAVGLDNPCVAAVHATPNLWVQIQVTGQAQPMPRTQIGAVPYALEAARTVVGVNGQLYSLGATYCGSTAPQNGNLKAAVAGAANGYVAGKSLCEATCNSPSAHMCSTDDLGRGMAIGVTPPNGWSWGWYYNTQDCSAWTSNVSGVTGTSWTTPWGPGSGDCSVTSPVLCCD